MGYMINYQNFNNDRIELKDSSECSILISGKKNGNLLNFQYFY